MAEHRIERRLAAILAADIAGYSRLMSTDEEGTSRHLKKAHRKELIDPKITEHRGRIVKTTGDRMLVEFASVVDTVRCAVDVQRAMIERNVPVPSRIEFRIVINVGDTMGDAGDIYGDGVNVAARLEALADPGGVYVSRVVHDQVRDKLGFDFEDMGEREMKNIARPVRVYRVRMRPPTVADEPAPVLDRPSVAVLPFSNMSGDPSQEFFADGVVEDVTTLLSRLPGFFVIARNSAFTYKGRAARAWAKWYYITPESFVEVEALARRAIQLQPDYGPAHAILAAALAFGAYVAFCNDFLSMRREGFAEARRAVDLDGDNPDVLLSAGAAHYFLGLFKKSHGLRARAVELNPNGAMASAMCGLMVAINGRPDEGIALIDRAMRLSPRDPQTYLLHNWLGFCHLLAGRFDDAIHWCERSSQAKPRYFESWANMAAAFGERGHLEEAARALRKARELVPRLSLAIYRRPRAEGTLWPKLIEGLRKAGMPDHE